MYFYFLYRENCQLKLSIELFIEEHLDKQYFFQIKGFSARKQTNNSLYEKYGYSKFTLYIFSDYPCDLLMVITKAS
jgi:hypothetical protein